SGRVDPDVRRRAQQVGAWVANGRVGDAPAPERPQQRVLSQVLGVPDVSGEAATVAVCIGAAAAARACRCSGARPYTGRPAACPESPPHSCPALLRLNCGISSSMTGKPASRIRGAPCGRGASYLMASPTFRIAVGAAEI